MQSLEYCELWWSGGGHPRLTFYRPSGSETLAMNEDVKGDGWDDLEGAITQLGLSGWELVSASHYSGGLFFKRHLQ